MYSERWILMEIYVDNIKSKLEKLDVMHFIFIPDNIISLFLNCTF